MTYKIQLALGGTIIFIFFAIIIMAFGTSVNEDDEPLTSSVKSTPHPCVKFADVTKDELPVSCYRYWGVNGSN